MKTSRSFLKCLAIGWLTIGIVLVYQSLALSVQQQPPLIHVPAPESTEAATAIQISKIEIEAAATGFADSTFTINGYVGKPLSGSTDPVTGFTNFDPFQNRTLFSSKLGPLKIALQQAVAGHRVSQQEVDAFFTNAVTEYIALTTLATSGLDLFRRAGLPVNYPVTPVLRPKK
jgi:hypothetical protein